MLYDAWGNFRTTTVSGNTSLENSIVNSYNPFRYRGYYYDKDLGWHYLQTRYYNPQWGRFINADGLAYLGANGDLQAYNLFAYCSNNPIAHVDPTGKFIRSCLARFSPAFLVATTVNDIYQIATGNVSAEKQDVVVNGEKKEEIKIKSSCKLVTPIVRLCYSAYVNYINPETKNLVKGTSLGLEFEWELHNLAYELTFGKDEAPKDLDAGASIFSDAHGNISVAMKLAYMTIYSPVFVVWDLIANGGFNP